MLFFTRDRYSALQRALKPGASLLARTWGAFAAERAWSRADRAYAKQLQRLATESVAVREAAELSFHDGQIIAVDQIDAVVTLTLEGRGYWGRHHGALARQLSAAALPPSDEDTVGFAPARKGHTRLRVTFSGVSETRGLDQCLFDTCLFHELHLGPDSAIEVRILLLQGQTAHSGARGQGSARLTLDRPSHAPPLTDSAIGVYSSRADRVG